MPESHLCRAPIWCCRNLTSRITFPVDMSNDPEDEVKRRTKNLVRLTNQAFSARKPLPEDELANLGREIATERQLLIDAIAALLRAEDPEAAAQPGVAEFDAGFRYGIEFAGAIDDAKVVIERARRGRLLKLVR